jgi:hypothetical protein
MDTPFRVKQGAGKGDTKRPFKGKEFRSNYDNIFRKPKYDGKDSDFDSHDEEQYNEQTTKFNTQSYDL